MNPNNSVGENFVRFLLKTIFGQEFKHLSVTTQKVLYGADTSLHGALLDVYIEPEIEASGGKAAVYDIKPDLKDNLADKSAPQSALLPRENSRQKPELRR